MAVDAALAVRAAAVPRREALVASGIAAAVATLLVVLGPPAGDGAAHLYRTELVRDGALVWDGLWYAGHYPLASYSVLYYLAAAVVGNVPLVLLAVVLSSAAFAALVVTEWGTASVWPARAFAVAACAPLFTGTYAYAAGVAAALWGLLALQSGRRWIALALAGLALGFSPLAFVFLVIVLAAIVADRRPPLRRALPFAAGLVALGLLELGLALAFPAEGRYGFRLQELLLALAGCAAGTLVALRAPRGRLLAFLFLALGIACLLAFAVPSPIGSNLTRFREVAFPVVLLAAALASYRPRWLVLPALTLALAYTLSPYAAVATGLRDTSPASASFWKSTLALVGDAAPQYRVDVVPTFDNWEALHVPDGGVPLARGWYRQLDLAYNPLLYSSALTGAEYRRWLRSQGVRYVVLPLAPLDRLGAEPQATLFRSGRSGLVEVARTADAAVYELPDATPILTGPGRPRLTAYEHARIAGELTVPGSYVLRVRYTPYLVVRRGDACLAPGPDGMTRIVASSAGRFELGVPGPTELVRIAFGARPAACGD